MTKRVALYARVSTNRQAEHDVSIPDQLRHAQSYCDDKGWVIAETFIDAGASARDDNRPEFQRMIDMACVDPSPVDVILVHSQSRFFRDAISLGIYTRRLEKHGVALVSMTQEFGDGAPAELMRTILGAVDAHNSAETAKHVKRSMIENARQGFWNGAKPPFGYVTVEAERRGEKIKKKLASDPKQAELVCMIFDLCLTGHGQSGAMGVKQIAEHLNGRGFRTPSGALFSTGFVHKILTRNTYTGVHYFNQREADTKRLKPREEWVPMDVPQIIAPETFQKVQDRLKERAPDKIAPRLANNPVMLSGTAHCSECGSRLVLATGKSGRYRYMKCANQHTRGKTGCSSPARMPEAKLDDIVLNAIADRVLEKDRVKALIKEVIQFNAARKASAGQSLKQLRAKLREEDLRVGRLYEALEGGLVTDSASFRKRLSACEQRRDELLRLIGNQERSLAIPAGRITDKQVETFSNGLRAMLRSGSPAFRKAYVQLLVNRVDVSAKEIRISGSKATLAAAIRETNPQRAEVPSFVREWRTGEDSNPRPPDS